VQRHIVRLHGAFVYDGMLQWNQLRSLCQPERPAMRRRRRVHLVLDDDAVVRQIEWTMCLQCGLVSDGMLR
jgi:hypothetical protein